MIDQLVEVGHGRVVLRRERIEIGVLGDGKSRVQPAEHDLYRVKLRVGEALADAEEIFETEDGRYYEKRKEKARGAKRKLRNYYRKYLLYSKKMGTQIVQSDTSEDVMKKNEVVAGMRPSENELRTLYAKTRYVDGYEPTNDEVRRAKELMKSLNKNDNWV